MSTASATEGKLIAGKYRITRKLGSGGMADVFLARTEGAAGFARTVVIKRLAPALARDPDIVTMFLDEARIAACLHHGNIAQVFDFGEDAAGYFLAMEYLAGCDALELVRAVAPGYLPLSAAVTIALGAAAGLHHAHEQVGGDGRPLGIVHRDVTSSNVFVTTDGGVKVIDFGIARAADRATVTRTGLVKGTVAYLSPEQLGGWPVDRRSDLFQLGAVFYELVTGARPFDRPGDPELAIMKRIESGTFTPPQRLRPECPDDLAGLLTRLLAVDPAHRLPTGDAVVVEIDAVARRYGWSTTARELARVLRAVVPPGATDPGTATGRGPRDTDVESTVQVRDDPAAILAELEAPPRETAPIDAAPAEPQVDATVRARTPRARAAAPARDTAPAPPPPVARRRSRRPILVAGAAALVAAAVATAIVYRAGSPTPAGLDAAPADPWSGATRSTTPTAPSEPGVTAIDPPALAPGADDVMTGMCRTEFTEAMDDLRAHLGTDTPVRHLRERVELARGWLGDNPRFAGGACVAAATAPGRDSARLELGDAEAQIRSLETAKGLTFTVTDADNRAHYRDLTTGADLGIDEVDER